MPPSASTFAPTIDLLFFVILAITGTVFVAVEGLLIYCLLKYRRSRSVQAQFVHGNPALEVAWTIIPAVILITLAAISQIAWAKMKSPPTAQKKPITIELLAEQFAWNIRYPGADGKFGRIDVSLMNQENPWGRVDGDSDGADDIITLNQMHLPADRPVRLVMRSKDVIHSFFVPEFRFKQDIVPGMDIIADFHPTRNGEFEIACAEFCGPAHYRMRGFIVVEPQQQFEKWLIEQATQ